VNKAYLQNHSGTFQFSLLTVVFALPLIFSTYFPLVSQESLNNILSFEIGVLMVGFYLTGFVFIPIAIADNVWVRRICLLVACLLAIPFISGYRHDYGIYGLFGFCALLFANYSSVFIASIEFRERGKLTLEIGLRCIVYIVIFMLVSLLFDMKPSVSYWKGEKVLLFGTTYFGALALIDSQRYFSKAVNLFFHFINGTFVRAPKSKIRYKKGKIKAWVLSSNNMQRGPLMLITGSACTFIAGATLYGTLNMESWFAIAAIWLFCVPFLILGLLFLFAGITQPFLAWRAGPSLLEVPEHVLKEDNELYAKGFIPRYSKREKRSGFSLQLIHYKVDSIAGEEFIVEVKTLLNETMSDKNLQFITAEGGTTFQVEYSLPPADKIEPDTDGYHVWHLKATMHESVEHKGKVQNSYTWTVAFPLPTGLQARPPSNQ